MQTPGPPVCPPYSRSDVLALYERPLFALVDAARAVHRLHHADGEVQLCTLLSVKTGGCPEDCAYCPQSSHYETDVGPEKMLDLRDVVAAARRAKEAGSTRFCMGAAWREVKDGPAFERVLAMVREVKGVGLEACVTLGMLDAGQARRLKEAGLDAYNHNVDTSREHYRSIISTRTYDDRLRTLRNVRDAGITVCSGGIIGMGESVDDRCEMLRTLANLTPQPESCPINALVAVKGTPLGDMPPVDPLDLVRMVAVARLLMPRTRVRLSRGERRCRAKRSSSACTRAPTRSSTVTSCSRRRTPTPTRTPRFCATPGFVSSRRARRRRGRAPHLRRTPRCIVGACPRTTLAGRTTRPSSIPWATRSPCEASAASTRTKR